VYAKQDGSAAAPTAGLHFTPELLSSIREKGVEIVPILLHVGLGTFRPVKVDEIENHEMHAEYYEVTEDAANRVNAARVRGNRIFAVGTTSVRTVESAARGQGLVESSGDTSLYIYPGFKFEAIGAMLTNFHLPKSSLLLLVCAFGGKGLILDAYRHAVASGYRFYSYGDCMLIL
jgi:S-adenosylmethionine:tRNA ribosyltransferase-isomerase